MSLMHHLVLYVVVKIILLCACSVYICLCMCVSVFACVAFGRAYFLCTWAVISTALPITEIYIKPEINFILFSLFNYADICCEAELRTWILITLCVFFTNSLWTLGENGFVRDVFTPHRTQRTVGENTWSVCLSPSSNSHCTFIIRAS